MDDKEAGKLIAKGLVQRKIPSISLTSIGSNNFWRTIKIYVKDGRYRYEITDFTLDGPYESGTMEKRIEVAAGQVFSGSKSNSPKGHYKYLLGAVAETTEPEVISLEKAMSGNGRKEKDF